MTFPYGLRGSKVREGPSGSALGRLDGKEVHMRDLLLALVAYVATLAIVTRR
jgi:hypothetical protein